MPNTITEFSLPRSPSPRTMEQLEPCEGHQKPALNLGVGSIPIFGGEIVPLQDSVAPVYPQTGNRTRSASQSSSVLELLRSAHSSVVSLQSSHLSAQSFDGAQHAASNLAESSPHITDDITVPSTDPKDGSFTENERPSEPSPHLPATSNHPGSEHPLGTSKLESYYKTNESSDSTDQGALSLPLGSIFIVPMMPEAIPRYINRPIISKSRPIAIKQLLPLKQKFDSPTPPDGWEKCVHPEGAYYFFNSTQRIYADADLNDKSIYDWVMETIAMIQSHIKLYSIKKVVNSSDLVIYVVKNSRGKMRTCYYYVHHENRAVSESHLGTEIEMQYWLHCQFFPHSFTLTKEKIQELRDIIMHYIGDIMTSSKCSNSPYSLEELRGILQLTNDMERNLGSVSIGSRSCFARIMTILARSKYLHFHGEPCARIDRTTSVFGDDVHRRTWLVKTLSPVLFCAPDIHLKDLQSLWVDEVVHRPGVTETLKSLNSDWDRIILFAIVMLNANVALLAIQSIDNIGNRVRSPTQIASYVSTITSLGSIVIGLLLSRQNRIKLHNNADEFETYIRERNQPNLGLEALAILYSLPYALLMWGLVAFSLAVIFLCFNESDISTKSIVGVSCVLCLVLMFWCVYINWEKGGEDDGQAAEKLIGVRKLQAFMSNVLSFLTPGRQR